MSARLTPAAADLLRSIRATGFVSWSDLGIEAGRAAILEMKAFAGPAEPVFRVEEIRISRGDAHEMRAALYIPESPSPVPIMVYMHGGGWVLGSYTGVDTLARALVNRSGCAILSIDYRLAPECKHPAALEDVDRALTWVVANGYQRGLDPKCLAVGGDSSGANLAAAVSLLYRDRGSPTLAFQLLVYPALDHDHDNGSYQRYGDGIWSALSRADVVWFHNQYVNRPEDLDSPYVSPLRAESLACMPPTLLICAEVDPLFDESVEYARQLEAAGVPVELKIYPGMFHGFWRMRGALPEACDAIDHAAAGMKSAMTSAL
jgi:acetyl esterase